MINMGAATGRSHGACEGKRFWFIGACDGRGPGFEYGLSGDVSLVVVFLKFMSDLGIGFKMAG